MAVTDLIISDFIAPATDGYPLAMRLVSAQSPTMAVLMSSGTGFPKGFYDRFARHLAHRGAAVLTYDFRGIAGSRPEDLAAMTMDYVDWGRLDMPAALDALIEAAPGLPVVHVGHSVGGHFLGFMANQDRIARHAFVSVGSGYWGRHHRSYNPMELFFWFGFGPWSLARHGYIKGGGLWAGTDLPRGVWETWRRWCLKEPYFLDELRDGLKPHHLRRGNGPDPLVDLHGRPHRHARHLADPAADLPQRPARDDRPRPDRFRRKTDRSRGRVPQGHGAALG